MKKFSDGFSDSSYEELLSEYAGESLGNKASKAVPNEALSDTKKAPAYEEPVFNIDISRKKKPDASFVDKSTKYEPIAPFEAPKAKPQPVIEKKAEAPKGKSDTMKFKGIKKTPTPKTTYERVEKQSKSAPEILVKGEGKKKLDFNSVKNSLLNLIMGRKKLFTGLCCCIIVAIILSSCALSCINDVLAMNRDNAETVEVVLPNDAKTFDAVRALDKAGLIKNTMFCNLYLKIMGYTDNNYLPGVYYFTEDMGVEKMITRFKTNTTRGAVVSVTIPEGYTIDQIFERLEKNDICTKQALYKQVDSIDFSSEYDFLANLDETEKRYHVLEGYMYPATYEFEQGADPATVIRKFLDTFESRWSKEYASRAKELSMSVDDIITLASIVEKEGANREQFDLVSSVLHNRLNRSGLFPTLECNSTQDYVTNTIAKRITIASELNPYILEYSTYESAGLPPGAICNPGDAAIKAALYPETSQYYYFRHDKNNKIYMAETLEEHNANGRTVSQVNAEET